jgi:hypothetical protein
MRVQDEVDEKKRGYMSAFLYVHKRQVSAVNNISRQRHGLDSRSIDRVPAVRSQATVVAKQRVLLSGQCGGGLTSEDRL